MRQFVITYCLLTLLFAGGCTLVLFMLGARAEFLMIRPEAILALATVGNAIFILMAVAYAGRLAFYLAGVTYAALQCYLFWVNGLAEEWGELAVLIILLFCLKGLLLIITGQVGLGGERRIG